MENWPVSLRAQLHKHRQFLLDDSIKTVSRAKHLEVIQSVEELAHKVLQHPAFEQVAEELAGKWLGTCLSLTNTIVTTGAHANHGTTQKHLFDPSSDEGAAVINESKPVIQLNEKGIIERFRAWRHSKS